MTHLYKRSVCKTQLWWFRKLLLARKTFFRSGGKGSSHRLVILSYVYSHWAVLLFMRPQQCLNVGYEADCKTTTTSDLSHPGLHAPSPLEFASLFFNQWSLGLEKWWFRGQEYLLLYQRAGIWLPVSLLWGSPILVTPVPRDLMLPFWPLWSAAHTGAHASLQTHRHGEYTDTENIQM